MTTEPPLGEPSDEARREEVAPSEFPEPVATPAGAAPTTQPVARDTGFLPAEPSRRAPETALVRVVATAGVVGIGTALGAILAANDVEGWITGLVVSAVSVILAAILWRSRRL